MITKINIQEIGQKYQFENWNLIRSEINRLTAFPSCFSDVFLRAKRIQCSGVQILKPSKASMLNEKKDNLTKRRYVLDEKCYSASSLIAFFDCCSCDSEFKVEFNPSRCYLDSFLCKKCKKSVVHKCKDYRARYESSMLKTHGVKRPLQSTVLHSRFIKTMQKKYGVHYSGESSELLAKTISHAKFNGSSRGEQELYRFLHDEYGEVVKGNGSKILLGEQRWVYPDIMITNLVIEYFGDYWHGNPKLYSENDVVAHNETARNVWQIDEQRLNKIRMAGFHVFVVWENDWKKNGSIKEEIKQWISSHYIPANNKTIL